MTRSIQIIETRLVNNGEQISVQNAIYRGSKPFSGTFEVFDLDTCIHNDPVSGKTQLTVVCQFGTQNAEDPELVFELPDGALGIVGTVGGGMDVAARIDFA